MDNKDIKKEEKIITIEEILKRKEYFTNKKKETMTLNVPSLGRIEIVKPDKELCIDITEMEDLMEGDRYFAYEVIKSPDLHSTKLHEEFGCKDNPIDIIDILLNPGEINDIAKIAMKFAGFGTVKEIENLKN